MSLMQLVLGCVLMIMGLSGLYIVINWKLYEKSVLQGMRVLGTMVLVVIAMFSSTFAVGFVLFIAYISGVYLS